MRLIALIAASGICRLDKLWPLASPYRGVLPHFSLAADAQHERRLLYVAEPGIRNDSSMAATAY